MALDFKDNRIEIKGQISEKMEAWLQEAVGELEAQVKRNTKVKTGKTKGSWGNVVDVAKGEAYVGSPDQNAIWEEYGTGEYALNGDGRKGGWYIPIGADGISEQDANEYGFKIVFGKGGKKFAFTKGKKPRRALFNAFNSKKNAIIRAAEAKMKELGND